MNDGLFEGVGFDIRVVVVGGGGAAAVAAARGRDGASTRRRIRGN